MKVTLALLGTAAVVIAVAAYLLVGRGSGQNTDTRQLAAAQATSAALRTVVASQQAQAVAQQTQIAQLRQQIALLQSIGPAPTTVTQGNGPHGYLASFQVGKYTYIMYLEWVESTGFIHNGHLFTIDNYGHRLPQSFQFEGVNNNGSYGFTMSDHSVTSTFSGKANGDRTFNVIGLPWNVFSGFIGGTFTQTLHAATKQDYNAAVANLGSPPQ